MFTEMLLTFAVNRLPSYRKLLVVWAIFCFFYAAIFDPGLTESSLGGLFFRSLLS